MGTYHKSEVDDEERESKDVLRNANDDDCIKSSITIHIQRALKRLNKEATEAISFHEEEKKNASYPACWYNDFLHGTQCLASEALDLDVAIRYSERSRLWKNTAELANRIVNGLQQSSWGLQAYAIYDALAGQSLSILLYWHLLTLFQ